MAWTVSVPDVLALRAARSWLRRLGPSDRWHDRLSFQVSQINVDSGLPARQNSMGWFWVSPVRASHGCSLRVLCYRERTLCRGQLSTA